MPSLVSSSDSLTPNDQAILLSSPRKFHRVFTVPATDSHGVMRVTYSIAGVDDDEDGDGKEVQTILWCGAMFGSRWQAVETDWLARMEGVRVLFLDRPGFGGSTPIPLPQRIPFFLELIPLLLTHLKVTHIHLASHSAGTLYALNLLHCHPELLYPENPSLYMFSPWVHQSKTGVKMLQAASILPNPLLNYWDSLTGFMLNRGMKNIMEKGSSGAISSFTNLFKSRSKEEGRSEEEEEEEEKCMEGRGFGLKVKEELDKVCFKYMWAENTKGANEEARLCLKSVEGADWGVLEGGYEGFVKVLGNEWEKRVGDGGSKFRIRVLYGNEDVMMGEKGMSYFERCWESEVCGKGIEVTCQRIEGRDHDSVVDPVEGAVRIVFKEVRRGREEKSKEFWEQGLKRTD